MKKKDIISFLFASEMGWTLWAFIMIFPLAYFDMNPTPEFVLPKWTFLIPITWIAYVFIRMSINGLTSLFTKKRKDED